MRHYEYSIEVEFETPISNGSTAFRRRVEGSGTATAIAEQLGLLATEIRQKGLAEDVGQKGAKAAPEPVRGTTQVIRKPEGDEQYPFGYPA